jgi:hypothetical protein
VELPQSPATVRAYREKGPADRRSQLLGVVDEHDIAKRGEPKRIFGFEEQDRLAPIPAHGAGLRCHRLQISLTRLWRTSVASCADENGRIFEELKQGREIPRGHLLLQIVQDPLRARAPTTVR